MKKVVTTICLFSALFSCNINYSQSNSNEELKKMFFGKWQLFDDKKFVINFTNDNLIYIYDGKITDKNPIIYLFTDDSKKFKKNKNQYDFKSKKILNKSFIIKEYDGVLQDTVISYILNIDAGSLEMFSRNRYVTFKRIIAKTGPRSPRSAKSE